MKGLPPSCGGGGGELHTPQIPRDAAPPHNDFLDTCNIFIYLFNQ